jgi:hypothetical protein
MLNSFKRAGLREAALFNFALIKPGFVQLDFGIN